MALSRRSLVRCCPVAVGVNDDAAPPDDTLNSPSISAICPSSLRARMVKREARRARDEARRSRVRRVREEESDEWGTVIFLRRL